MKCGTCDNEMTCDEEEVYVAMQQYLTTQVKPICLICCDSAVDYLMDVDKLGDNNE